LGSGTLQARSDALRDTRALELRDGPQDVHLQLPSRCGRVDPLVQGHERDTERVQLLEQGDQVSKVAAQAIESPDDQHIKPPAPGVGEQVIEGRLPVLCAADAAVDVFGDRPATGPGVPPQLRELVFRFLVVRRDASVDGRSHGVRLSLLHLWR
jgi:hypothetical protein